MTYLNQVTIVDSLFEAIAILISIAILRPIPKVCPYEYFVYGEVVAIIGFPGTLRETSYTTISNSGVTMLCRENGPIIPGGYSFLTAFVNLSPSSNTFSSIDSLMLAGV